ncbi:MAG: carboxypeptidase-like regulatory domain-containing protein [Bacteroidota bacterium]
MIWIFFIILSFFFIPTSLNAQNNAIQGTVKDVDGNPILGANVILLEFSKGVSSNLEGEFIIQGLNKGSYFIQVRYLGYRPITRRINIPDDAIVDFTLSEVFDQLEEVVVTANRRLQDIQKTAASVSAIGFKQVEQLQIKQFSELNSIAPNFRTYDNGGIGAFTLVASRGISTVDTNPAIGLYIDGIPYFSTLNFPLTLNDVNQIEVLRGPQGTLYGKNALAGIVKITTKSPSNQVTGYGNVGFGNLNSKEFGFGLSLPVVKNKLFFRTNANIQDRDGFVTNNFNGEELQNREAIDANFRMKYFASEKLDFSLLYSLQHREAKSSAFVLVSEQNPLTSILENSPFEVNFNETVFRDAFTQNMALNLNYRFGSFSLNSTTSYQVTDSERFDEFDYRPLDLQAGGGELTFQTVRQEFRLQSTAERSLIVDEPTTGLDPMERNRFYNWLSELGKANLVILFAHIVEDVSTLCNDMAIIRQGEVIITGKPDEVEALLRRKIWEKQVEKSDLNMYKEKYDVIANHFHRGNRMITRATQDLPKGGPHQKSPTLENVYFNSIQNQQKALVL